MKILYLIDTFFPVIGGITTVVDKMATCLSNYADVTVAAVKAKGYVDEKRPYKILRCKGFYSKITKDGFGFPSLDKNFRKEIKNGNFDIIHVHTVGNFFNYGIKLGKKLGVPVVNTMHVKYYDNVLPVVKSKFITKIVTKVLIRKNYKADYIWTVCENSKKDYLSYLPCKKEIKVMRSCTELTDNADVEKFVTSIKKKYNLKKEQFVCTYVARMVKIKNVDLIIDSINYLKDKNLNIKIILVGGGPDLQYFKEKVENLGLNNYFIFTDMVRDRNEIAALYKLADLTLFPSLSETSGSTQLESAALKTPTLVIKDQGPAELIVDGVNGLICDPSVESFSEKLLFAYNNKSLMSKLGDEAYKTVYIGYNEDYAKKVLSIYQSYINEFQVREIAKQKKRVKQGAT